ncbi:MAG TPA: Na/Pi symporter, partial [Flavipsychrobacter sp.]
ITGWIVSLLGFKFSIKDIVLPFVAAGGIGIVLFSNEKLVQLSKFLMGFSLMFLGIDFMRTGFEAFAQQVDFGFMQSTHPMLFLLVGALLAASIHSSSASIMIFLSSLAAGIITLDQGLYLVIGADLGTSLTAVLATIKGNPIKKKVGWSQLYFNVINAIVALVFMRFFLFLITDILSIKDPLITMVAFHSSFNIATVILLLPFTSVFTKAIDKMVGNDKHSFAPAIALVNPAESHAAIEALKKEAASFIRSGISVNKEIFDIEEKVDDEAGFYYDLKKYEAEITDFYLKLEQGQLSQEEAEQANSLATIIRNTTLSVKDAKDIKHNLSELERSGNDKLYNLYIQIVEAQQGLYKEGETVLHNIHYAQLADIAGIDAIIHKSQLAHSKSVFQLHADGQYAEVDLPTLFNMLRGINNSNESLLRALSQLIQVK